MNNTPSILPHHIDTGNYLPDEQFDKAYPRRIQQLSARHWTPVRVAALGASFLAEDKGSRILDIGSGAGKFCLVGAQQRPASNFYGIEQRKKLVQIAEKARKRLGLENAVFIEGNFTQIDFRKFDHFYFYNSFYENLVEDEYHIDESIDHSLSLYEYYTHYLYRLFAGRPVGTKLVTYHSYKEVVPDSYRLVSDHYHSLLRYWIQE